MSIGQAKALQNHYEPFVKRNLLPAVDWPTWSSRLVNEARCHEIAKELLDSRAKLVITLGNDPLRLLQVRWEMLMQE